MAGAINYVDGIRHRPETRNVHKEQQAAFALAQEALDRQAKRRDDSRVEAERRAFVAKTLKEAEERKVQLLEEEAARRDAWLENEVAKEAAHLRQLRRQEFLSNKWNLFRIWLYGLFGVSTYEIIRSIKGGYKGRD